MEHCPFCRAELPLDARFCGHCGRMQQTTSAINKTVLEHHTQFNQKPDDEDQDERRRALLPDFALPIGLGDIGQQTTVAVPAVQGTPQVSSVPQVQGAPSFPAGSSPLQGLVHEEAPSAPSSYSSIQAPSPAQTYPVPQTPLPQTGQQPLQMHVSQPPPHTQPVTPPPYHPEEPVLHHAHEPHTHQTHHRPKYIIRSGLHQR